MVLTFIAIGFRKTFVMLWRFPGVFLLPMFSPFTFGPVLATYSCCCNRTDSERTFRYGKSPMQLSFLFTFINIAISSITSINTMISSLNNGDFFYFRVLLITFVLPLLIVGLFPIFEKCQSCCCNFCLPFTKRETFDIGNVPAWRDAMTDLSHLYQDTPDARVEEAIELEDLGKGNLI